MDVSQKLTINPSPVLKLYMGKCERYLVTSQELRFLSKLYRDLASRSGGTSVDKTTFLQFFPLPVSSIQGLWGERLFEKFDVKLLGSIDFEEFIQGMALCCRGSEEERLRFLFTLYDLKGDGLLDKAELVSMVRVTQMYNTYKHTMRGSPSSEASDGAEESKEVVSVMSIRDTRELSPRASLLMTPDLNKRLERKSSAALLKRDDFGTKEKVDIYVDKVMMDLQAETALDFGQFVKFVHQNPRIMEVFAATFREEVWSTARLTEELSDYQRTYKRKKRAGCFSCFSVQEFTSVRITTPRTTTAVVPNLLEKTGWLTLRVKDGSEPAQKMFVALKNTMLLSYSNSASAMPSSVIFLEGCFIESIEEVGASLGFGLEVTHQFGGFKEVTMWCSSEEERNDWLQKLVQAAKTRKVEEYYEFKEKIGTGKFSDVYTAVEMSTNLQWAIKVVEKKRLNEQEREMMRSEVAIMRLLNHNNVVQMKEVFEDKQKMYLITELVEGGELFDRIRHKKVFSEYTSFFITRQLLDAVKYLHDVGIVHRDIKPENILLTDDSEIPTIKLADFGLSKLVGPNDRLRTACGTLAYVAPEVLMQRPYSKPVDIWSIGIVTYLMLRGRLPFDSKDRHILIQKTIEADLDLSGPYWDKFTPYVLDFLKKTIEKDIEVRMTVDQALTHAWIRNGDILIPRKINKRTMEEELLRKTLTSTKMQSSIYSENPKAMTLEPPNADAPGPRVIYTTPDIYEDMEVSRRPAEQSLAIQLA